MGCTSILDAYKRRTLPLSGNRAVLPLVGTALYAAWESCSSDPNQFVHHAVLFVGDSSYYQRRIQAEIGTYAPSDIQLFGPFNPFPHDARRFGLWSVHWMPDPAPLWMRLWVPLLDSNIRGGIAICIAVIGFVLTVFLLGHSSRSDRSTPREIVGVLAHEFRNPLASLRHMTELLALNRIETHERQHTYIHALHAETARLCRRVDQHLTWFAANKGKAAYRWDGACQRLWDTP
jgi:signal transduction histidine kinase